MHPFVIVPRVDALRERAIGGVMRREVGLVQELPFESGKKLSATALSQRFPRRLMLARPP